MNELVEKIINIDNTNVIESMDDITLDNNICLEYMDYYGNTYYYNNKISSCLLGHNKIIDKELIKFKQSGEETSFEKILNPINNSVSLLYGIKKGNGYIFLFTSLEDIGTTTSLIKNQLIFKKITYEI